MTNPTEGDRTNGDSATPTTEKLIRIMRQNAPILHFDRDEEYFTYNVPDYLAAVDLCDAKTHDVIASAPLTPAKLPVGKPSSATYLSIPKDRQDIRKGDRSKTAVYVHAVGWKIGDDIGFDFQYFFFYAYNGTATFGYQFYDGGIHQIPIPGGAHEGDWESIIVRTDVDGQVIAIYCNQHDSGAWYLPQEVTWTDGYPNIYVARSGHPSYVGVGIFYNASFFIKQVGAKVGLVNETSQGHTLPTASVVTLVATTGIDGAHVVSPPWWLDYRGRFGLVVFTKEEEQKIKDLVGFISSSAADWLVKTIEEIEPDGPEAPIAKDWWAKPIPGGPSRYAPYWWSGDVRISSLPNKLHPQSSFGPSMAARGDDTYIVYKGASSDRLLWAWRDDTGWHGNTAIKVSKTTLESDARPGLAFYAGKAYMVYKERGSTALRVASLADGSWHGGDPITTSAGHPASSTSPALAEFDGSLYAAYKEQKLDKIFFAWFDGTTWHGNVPIVDADTKQAATSHTAPALVAYGADLYLIYLEASSGDLHFARFRRGAWALGGPILVDGKPLTSKNAPSAAVVDGRLMVLFIEQRPHLPSSHRIFWTAYDDISGQWRGNEDIGWHTSIEPRSDHQVGVTAFRDGLVMVYKGATSSDFYQAEFTKHG